LTKKYVARTFLSSEFSFVRRPNPRLARICSSVADALADSSPLLGEGALARFRFRFRFRVGVGVGVRDDGSLGPRRDTPSLVSRVKANAMVSGITKKRIPIAKTHVHGGETLGVDDADDDPRRDSARAHGRTIAASTQRGSEITRRTARRQIPTDHTNNL